MLDLVQSAQKVTHNIRRTLLVTWHLGCHALVSLITLRSLRSLWTWWTGITWCPFRSQLSDPTVFSFQIQRKQLRMNNSRRRSITNTEHRPNGCAEVTFPVDLNFGNGFGFDIASTSGMFRTRRVVARWARTTASWRLQESQLLRDLNRHFNV